MTGAHTHGTGQRRETGPPPCTRAQRGGPVRPLGSESRARPGRLLAVSKIPEQEGVTE